MKKNVPKQSAFIILEGIFQFGMSRIVAVESELIAPSFCLLLFFFSVGSLGRGLFSGNRYKSTTKCWGGTYSLPANLLGQFLRQEVGRR